MPKKRKQQCKECNAQAESSKAAFSSSAQTARGAVMFRGLPLARCQPDESVWDAAARAGYPSPTHRVGMFSSSKPGEVEALVAWVKASKHASPLPVFAKNASRKENE